MDARLEVGADPNAVNPVEAKRPENALAAGTHMHRGQLYLGVTKLVSQNACSTAK